MADPLVTAKPGTSGADPLQSGEVSGKNIVRALLSVDDSFSMLKPGRDLDDRLGDLLDGTAAPPQRVSRRTVAVGAMALATGVVALALLLPHGKDDVAAAPPTAPPTLATPALAPAPALEQTPPTMLAKTTEPKEPSRSTSNAKEPKEAGALPAVKGKRIEVAYDVRFVDVQLGRLEVRPSSIVDVDKDGAVVVRGSARLLEPGKAPRMLQTGETIGWKMPAAPPSKPALKLDDAEVQATLERAHALQARGSYAEAADVLADLLAKKPTARVTDTVSYQRASLLAKARDISDACDALAEHAKKFPRSDNAADVAAARARLSCK